LRTQANLRTSGTQNLGRPSANEGGNSHNLLRGSTKRWNVPFTPIEIIFLGSLAESWPVPGFADAWHYMCQ